MFRRIGDESALIRNFLRNGRVRGKPIGRVRVKEYVKYYILVLKIKVKYSKLRLYI